MASPDPVNDPANNPANDPQEGPSTGTATGNPGASNPARRQSRLSLPVFQHLSRYSVTSYRRDAVLLRQIILGINRGLYHHLGEIILDYDDLTVDVLYKTMCSDINRREEFVRQAETLLAQPGNLTTTIESFQRFLYRFREGPSQDAIEEEPAPSHQSQQGRDEHCRPTPLRAEELRDPTPSEIQRARGMSSQPASRGGYQASQPGSQPPLSRDGLNEENAPPQQFNSPGWNVGISREYGDGMSKDTRNIRLKPQDIMEFDPKRQKVALFLKRIDQMSRQYGNQAVLDVLPLCVKNDALEWYTGLNQNTTEQMSDSLAVWKDQLRRRFASDSMDALDEAYRLRFRWDREDTMDLRQYVTRKVLLLKEARILDEDQQVKLIWRGLDANLMSMVSPLANGGNTVDGFAEDLYQHEYAAKRLWRESQRPAPTPRPRIPDATPRYQPRGGAQRAGDSRVARIEGNVVGPSPERRLTFP